MWVVQLAVLEAKVKATEAAARQAEEVAAAAMSAAEGAVRDEMEATAVAKGTESALRKALEELKELGLGYDLPLDRKTLVCIRAILLPLYIPSMLPRHVLNVAWKYCISHGACQLVVLPLTSALVSACPVGVLFM